MDCFVILLFESKHAYMYFIFFKLFLLLRIKKVCFRFSFLDLCYVNFFFFFSELINWMFVQINLFFKNPLYYSHVFSYTMHNNKKILWKKLIIEYLHNFISIDSWIKFWTWIINNNAKNLRSQYFFFFFSLYS